MDSSTFFTFYPPPVTPSPGRDGSGEPDDDDYHQRPHLGPGVSGPERFADGVVPLHGDGDDGQHGHVRHQLLQERHRQAWNGGTERNESERGLYGCSYMWRSSCENQVCGAGTTLGGSGSGSGSEKGNWLRSRLRLPEKVSGGSGSGSGSAFLVKTAIEKKAALFLQAYVACRTRCRHVLCPVCHSRAQLVIDY